MRQLQLAVENRLLTCKPPADPPSILKYRSFTVKSQVLVSFNASTTELKVNAPPLDHTYTVAESGTTTKAAAFSGKDLGAMFLAGLGTGTTSSGSWEVALVKISAWGPITSSSPMSVELVVSNSISGTISCSDHGSPMSRARVGVKCPHLSWTVESDTDIAYVRYAYHLRKPTAGDFLGIVQLTITGRRKGSI